jgi:hypothetical protein
MSNSNRTQKAISKSIVSFGGSQANQWNTLALLASEVASFYWNKSRQSSLIVELDSFLQAPHSNKNMAKAFRLFIADTTPVILKNDLTDTKHGSSNSHKAKKMTSDFDAIATTIDGMIDGDTLKAYLNNGEAKTKAKPTVKSKAEALAKFMQADGVTKEDLQAASEAIQALQAVYSAKLEALSLELGLDGLVEPNF